MGNRFFNLAGLIVGGVIVANLVANGGKTVQLIDALGGVWKSSVNGLLGKPS